MSRTTTAADDDTADTYVSGRRAAQLVPGVSYYQLQRLALLGRIRTRIEKDTYVRYCLDDVRACLDGARQGA